jgi:hypothetical protein
LKWAVIAEIMYPRTDNQCWRRWKTRHGSDARALSETKRIRKKTIVQSFLSRDRDPSKLTVEDAIHASTAGRAAGAPTIQCLSAAAPSLPSEIGQDPLPDQQPGAAEDGPAAQDTEMRSTSDPEALIHGESGTAAPSSDMHASPLPRQRRLPLRYADADNTITTREQRKRLRPASHT